MNSTNVEGKSNILVVSPFDDNSMDFSITCNEINVRYKIVLLPLSSPLNKGGNKYKYGRALPTTPLDFAI
jgi:hypothetical protein